MVALIFLFNTGATFFFWYSRIWWFDMPMHFAGGLFISLITVFVVEKYLRPRRYIAQDHSVISRYLIIFLCIAIGWEVYEIAVDVYFSTHTTYLLDSLSDICFDLAGGALGLVYIFMRYPFYRQQQETSAILK